MKRKKSRPSKIDRLKLGADGLPLIDLFCGAGGMTLGFVKAGFTSVYANDHDKHAIDTYRANFGDHASCDDIRNVTKFPAAEVVIGGPPCQGFSRLGKQATRERTENLLWKEYVRCVKDVRPKVFVIENVPEFFKDPAWPGVRSAAERLGYKVVGKVLNAADYGVPQRRQRAIIIGSRIGEPELPPQTHRAPGQMFPPGLPAWRTVRDAIGDLPLQPTDENRHDRRNVGEISLARYRHIPPGGNRKNLPPELQPDCWKYKDPRGGGSTDLMGRLTWDAPSLTIRTQFLKPEKGCYLHPQDHRSLTVREGARLQTFPDDFAFVGSNFQAAKQIGNAVPVGLAYQIARWVRQHIGLPLAEEETTVSLRPAAGR